MLTHTDLKKGVKIIVDKEPYEVLEARPLKMAQRRVVIQTKIRNLITGSVFSKNFHQGETFQEANISKIEAKFSYSHRNRYFFSKKDDPSERFDLTSEQVGPQARFLKPSQIIEEIIFEDKIINISLPIKVQLKVTESPPGIRGGRSNPGKKQVTLETGAKINVPLFVKEGDLIEINTETGEYTKRIE